MRLLDDLAMDSHACRQETEAAAWPRGTSTRAGRRKGSKSASASVDGGRREVTWHRHGCTEAAEQFAPWDGPAARMSAWSICERSAKCRLMNFLNGRHEVRKQDTNTVKSSHDADNSRGSRVRGVFVPALTPFHPDLSVDTGRFVAHCRALINDGADGLAVFGTTSEANSLSVPERMEALDRLIDSGIATKRLMPGTGCCALPDTVALTRHAVEHGCLGVLLLPPFYYKGVGDDGLFASIAEVIARVADSRLRIYLYHIPSMAGVGFSLPLVEHLLENFPGTVVGLKDSSGDWKNTQALLQAFPGFEVFPGSETYLLDALRAGGAGCISATANVNVAAMKALLQTWRSPAPDAMQQPP